MVEIIGEFVVDLIADDEQLVLFSDAGDSLQFQPRVRSPSRVARVIDHERLDAFAAGLLDLLRGEFKTVLDTRF